jgi:hypothetical protein
MGCQGARFPGELPLHRTQSDAILRATEIVRRAGGGETVIHGRDGRIRDSDTIAPGHDPFPPRDERH